MPTPDRPQAPVARTARDQAAAPARPTGGDAPAPPGVMPGILSAAKEVAKSALFEKRPYLKFAFSNPYNVSLFVGVLAAAGITLNVPLLLLALGAEALWLLHAPDSKRLQHILWDPKFDKLRQALVAEERGKRLDLLAAPERKRVEKLIGRQADIHTLAAQNPSFTGELLRTELTKTERLVDAFIDMAVTTVRYDAYLRSVDIDGLDADRARLEREIKFGKDGDQQLALSKKNLAIILKRLEKMKEIRRYLDLARGQLDLIENSFQLIGDQIVTMQSPQELSGQLNELLDGVESIRQTAAETDRILGAIGTTVG